MTIRWALVVLVGLSSCGTLDAYRARSVIPGHTEPDVLACMGPPDNKIATGSPGESVLGWTYIQSGTDVDLEFGLYALKLGRPGQCRTHIRFMQGIATSVHYSFADVSATNPDSICGRMVEECLTKIDKTQLPTGYDPNVVLLGPKESKP